MEPSSLTAKGACGDAGGAGGGGRRRTGGGARELPANQMPSRLVRRVPLSSAPDVGARALPRGCSVGAGGSAPAGV